MNIKNLLVLKKYALLISIGYTVSLLALSLLTLDFDKIEDLVPSFSDKIFHFGAYALLTLVWFYTLTVHFNFTKIKALLIVTSASIAFGTIIEVLQKELTNTRTFDWYDVTANMGGVVIAASIVLFYKKSDVK
ncbi:VanZ family protein [Bizionia sp. M204]|uniref:VanZ family protein n=1 Tax=unclassified Bizionia TaxID=2626393 RepID=UPI002048D464|nr:VanZ family protein [Bizionia sp. M204]UPS92943.1 teicoplanin resistance protein VanZ [Bizionia sp. M204]